MNQAKVRQEFANASTMVCYFCETKGQKIAVFLQAEVL